jgi:hypothetical protein
MINSDQINVAMTKTCGLVVTLACQSNTFNKSKEKKITNWSYNYASIDYEILFVFAVSDNVFHQLVNYFLYLFFVCFVFSLTKVCSYSNYLHTTQIFFEIILLKLDASDLNELPHV